MMQTVIQVYGPSCAGKTTLVKNFLEENKSFFHLDIDKLRWFFGDYRERKKELKPILRKGALEFLRSLVSDGISVIFEGHEEISQEVFEICKKLNIPYIEVNVETDFEKVLERFRERIRQVDAGSGTVSNRSEERLKEIYDRYFSLKKEDILTLDSGKLSEKEMLEKFLEYISI